jgi:lipid-A-disaccharide synthase
VWGDAGVRATFVGHPAAELAAAVRSGPPPAAEGAPRVALLPGSRAGEVCRLLGPLLAAARRLRGDGVACELLLAESLDPTARASAARAATEAGFPVRRSSAPLIERLSGFQAAISASGTATLECALAGVPPVIAYRADRLTAAAFRRLAHADQIGLPNVLLNQLVFPECLQERADGATLAEAARGLLRRPPSVRDALLRQVRPAGDQSFGARVVALLPRERART